MDTDKKTHASAQIAGYALVVLGLVAIACGLAWRQIVPDEVIWSESDAREFVEADEAAHAASIPHVHGEHEHGAGATDLDAALEHLAQVEERLERARHMRENWGRILAVVGAVLAVAGVVLLRKSA